MRARRGTFWKCIGLIERRRRRQWVGLVVLAVLSSFAEAAAAIVVFLLVSMIAPEPGASPPFSSVLPEGWDARSERLWLAAGAGIFFIARAFIYLAQTYVQNRVAYGTGVDLARRLLRGYLRAPYELFIQKNSPELIRNAHESSLLLSLQVLVPALMLTSETLVAIAIVAVLLMVSPAVTAGALAALTVVVVVVLRVVQPRLGALGELAHTASAASLKELQHALHGFRIVRLLGREGYFEERFGAIRTRMGSAYYRRAVLIDVPRVSLETILLLFIIAAVAMSAFLADAGTRLLSSIGLFGYAGLRLLPSMNRVVNALQSIRFGRPLIDELYRDLLESDSYPAVTVEDVMVEFEREVRFTDVSYRYPGTNHDALIALDFVLHRGEFIGVVGRTGSGKSTFIDLLAGLLQPTRGSVTVDGVDIAKCAAAWQRRLGVVPQATFVVDDTLKRNVALGISDSDMSEERLGQAIRVAGLEDVVEALPAGLDTELGEHGVRLSGGQRQRVAIARAIYRRPDVLILDEGTSALDTSTEAAVVGALEEMRRDVTLIAVAHRLSTVRACDRIVLMESGRIVDVGTYNQLLETSAAFRALASHPPTQADAAEAVEPEECPKP